MYETEKKIFITKHENVERLRPRTLTFPLEMNTGLPEDGGALYIYVTSEKDNRKKEIQTGTHSAFAGWPLHNVLTDSWRKEPPSLTAL